METPEWYDQRHHRGDGDFRNIWNNDRDASFVRAIRWIIGRALTRRDHITPPAHPVRQDALASPPQNVRLTWIGHATMYVQAGDLRILIDPNFSNRASPVQFAGPSRLVLVPVPVQIEDLPGVDVVLISHDHYDHLDQRSITVIQRQFSPLFLVPLDVGDIVAGWGAQHVQELDWWQSLERESRGVAPGILRPGGRAPGARPLGNVRPGGRPAGRTSFSSAQNCGGAGCGTSRARHGHRRDSRALAETSQSLA